MTLSRRERVDFSLPTLVDGANLMVKGVGPSSIVTLSGRKVGVLEGTTTEQGLRSALNDAAIDADITPFKTHTDGVTALQTGAIAAYFGDSSILLYLAMNTDAKDLNIANEYFSFERYALAIPRNDDDFRVSVDRALSGIYRRGAFYGDVCGNFWPAGSADRILKDALSGFGAAGVTGAPQLLSCTSRAATFDVIVRPP